MCPMRFLLVFFSAVLAGYVAWRTVGSSSDIDDIVSEDSEKIIAKDKQEFSIKRVCVEIVSFPDMFPPFF